MVTGLSSFLYSNVYLPYDDTSDEVRTTSQLQERKDNNLPNNDPITLSSTYAQTFGVSLQSYTMFAAIIIVPSLAQEYNELCDRIMFSLSHYSIFCRLSAHNRDDLSCIIDNIHCDICIVYKELLGVVSQTYPDLCCSVFDYQYIKVIPIHPLKRRMIQILKTYSFDCLVFSTRFLNGWQVSSNPLTITLYISFPMYYCHPCLRNNRVELIKTKGIQTTVHSWDFNLCWMLLIVLNSPIHE